MTLPSLPFRLGRYLVTASMLSTSRQVFALRDIDHLECRRPLFLIVAPAAGAIIAIMVRFVDLLTPAEIMTVLLVCGVTTAISAQIGVLRLRSLSIRNEAIWGAHGRLQRVWVAAQVAMEQRLIQAERDRPTRTPSLTDPSTPRSSNPPGA